MVDILQTTSYSIVAVKITVTNTPTSAIEILSKSEIFIQ